MAKTRHSGPPSDDDPPDDEIGYRRPPKQCQFKKGKSGNPKGRPKKKAPEPGAIADQILATPIGLTLDGRSKTVPILEAMFLSLAVAGARGDVRSIALFFKAHKQYPNVEAINEAAANDYGAEVRRKLENMSKQMNANRATEADTQEGDDDDKEEGGSDSD